MDIILVFLVMLSFPGTTVSLQRFSPSAFQPGVCEHKTKVCFNIGSKTETIGLYQAETNAIAYPVGVQLPKELRKVKLNHANKRAFQVGLYAPNGKHMVVQMNPIYH